MEFRSDAVALWRASEGRRTFKDGAADLHVTPETLRTWVRDADGSPGGAGRSGPQSLEAENARLRTGNARLVRRRRSGSWSARSCAGRPSILPAR
ncbi:transposase [Kitasatospora sp. NPDC085895]|uniref:transposase n=1 Tax=Kitasatospora sp. NPDC085895 TaxID=3155057 RepID=UPI00344DF72F